MSDSIVDALVGDGAPAESGDGGEENQEKEGMSQNSGDAIPQDGGLNAAAKEVINKLEADQEAAQEGEGEKEEVEAKPKSWTLKVDGQDVTIDSEEDLLKYAQKGHSADAKWQEASQMRKQTEQFIQAIQNDPMAVLKQMGLDVDGLTEAHIEKRIEEMQKSPEQLEREAIQKELSDLKSEREQEQETARSVEMQRMQDKYAMEIETEITSVLDSSNTLPKSPYVVKRIADNLLLAMDQGLHDVTVADVLPIVENDIRNELKQMFSAMPDEIVEAVVGKDVLNRLRKGRVTKAKAAPVTKKIVATGNSEINQAKEARAKEKKPQNARNFFDNLGSY